MGTSRGASDVHVRETATTRRREISPNVTDSQGTGNQGREGEELGEHSVIDSLRPEGTFCCASEELPPL